jgi:hypothetical protein
MRVAYKPARRPDSRIRKAAQQHARQIGEIAIASNFLHGGLFRLFWTVLDKRDVGYQMAHAIWHSHTTDRAQRELLLSIATTAFHDKRRVPRILANIRWLIDRAGALSTYRNDAIHTPVRFAPYPRTPAAVVLDAASGRKQKVDRMEKLRLFGAP